MKAGVFVAIAVAVLAVICEAERDFPPPPMPIRPSEFNIYCDVCDTMVKRMTPYCERDDANLDYLPDFCVFNYNRVLRSECAYIVDVMEFAYCPSPCAEVRKLKGHVSSAVCYHPLVNCTERSYQPSPSASPSPSPSRPLPRDCVLCQYVLKQVALMCMNEETANKRTIYNQCMLRTWNHEDFKRCTTYLNELVDIANSTDPCTMLSCENPGVACTLTSPSECHVLPYSGPKIEYSQNGLDEDGNFVSPDNSSVYYQTLGMGPSDFAPGDSPYHSQYFNHGPIPDDVTSAGHLVSNDEPTTPVTPEGIAAADAQAAATVQQRKEAAAAAYATPTPVPLADIKMQL